MNPAMVVAMALMRVVKVSIDEIIDVVSVRDRRMSTSRPMHMVFFVPGACMPPSACIRIHPCHPEGMLFDTPIGGLMMQMAVVQVVDMAIVFNRGVPALGSMNMFMMFVFLRHCSSPKSFCGFRKFMNSGISHPVFSEPWARPLAIN